MKYECDACGACCSGLLIVDAEWLDAVREPRLLDADVSNVRISLDVLADDDGHCIILAATKPCRFLAPDKHCDIYATRPNCCVAFEAGSEQCQEVRKERGLPPLQPVS